MAENVPKLEERWRNVVKEKESRVERKVEEEDTKRKELAKGIVNESSRQMARDVPKLEERWRDIVS